VSKWSKTYSEPAPAPKKRDTALAGVLRRNFDTLRQMIQQAMKGIRQ